MERNIEGPDTEMSEEEWELVGETPAEEEEQRECNFTIKFRYLTPKNNICIY